MQLKATIRICCIFHLACLFPRGESTCAARRAEAKKKYIADEQANQADSPVTYHRDPEFIELLAQGYINGIPKYFQRYPHLRDEWKKHPSVYVYREKEVDEYENNHQKWTEENKTGVSQMRGSQAVKDREEARRKNNGKPPNSSKVQNKTNGKTASSPSESANSRGVPSKNQDLAPQNRHPKRNKSKKNKSFKQTKIKPPFISQTTRITKRPRISRSIEKAP